MTLTERFVPSEPCSCDICLNYCKRPGWWTPEEFARVLKTAHRRRVMLEMSPEQTLAVPSPAFHGCELDFALQGHAARGCSFLKNDLCELFGTGLQPLECRFCHHERPGEGAECHNALEEEWLTAEGSRLVDTWIRKVHFRHELTYRRLVSRGDGAGGGRHRG